MEQPAMAFNNGFTNNTCGQDINLDYFNPNFTFPVSLEGQQPPPGLLGEPANIGFMGMPQGYGNQFLPPFPTGPINHAAPVDSTRPSVDHSNVDFQYHAGVFGLNGNSQPYRLANPDAPCFRPAQPTVEHAHLAIAQPTVEHAHSGIAPKVPIPRAQSLSARVAARPTAVAVAGPSEMGPVSQEIKLPAKAKPGRKPLSSSDGDAGDRRRTQNRKAQRGFRDRRSKQVAELRDELEEHRIAALAEKGGYEGRIAELGAIIAVLRGDVASLAASLEEANRASSSATRGITSRPVALPAITTDWTGPVQSAAPVNSASISPTQVEQLETDMSHVWQSRQAQDSQYVTDMDVDQGPCGFCKTDDTFCLCKEARKPKLAPAPGSCDACQADPARAEACRSLKSQTTFGPLPPAATPPTNSSVNGSGNMMSCGSFIERLSNGRSNVRMPSIREILPGTFHSYPASGGAGAAYDVNEQEAAKVLQSLSTRDTRKPF